MAELKNDAGAAGETTQQNSQEAPATTEAPATPRRRAPKGSAVAAKPLSPEMRWLNAIRDFVRAMPPLEHDMEVRRAELLAATDEMISRFASA